MAENLTEKNIYELLDETWFVVTLSVIGALGVIYLVVWLKCIRPPADRTIRWVAPTLGEKAKQKVTYDTDSKEQFWTADRTQASNVRFARTGLASASGCPPTTVPKCFQKACETAGNKPALRVELDIPPFDAKAKSQPPSAPFEEWKTWTYTQYYNECHRAARAFVTLGLQRYDAVSIYGFNSPRWLMAQNAGMLAGGIAAGIYPSDTPMQVLFKAKHSSASIACCQQSKAKHFVDNFREGNLPALKAIVVWDQDIKEETLEREGQTVVITSWEKMLAKADQTPAIVVDQTIESIQPGDVACLIYTSGTTGDPKAVMITHDNILFESTCALSLLPAGFGDGEERALSYLPLSHVAGCMVDIVMPIVCTAVCPGYTVVGFARLYDLSKGTIGDRLRCVQPTIFLGVPRVWEKIAEKIQKLGKNITGIKKTISTFCKAKGLEHAANCQLGGSGQYPSWYPFAESKVFSMLKANLGLGSCKFAFTGAAPISKETLSYYGSLGLQVNEVYGMSECTGATTWSTDEAHVWGSCGFAMPGTEVAVFDVEGKELKECPRAENIFNPKRGEEGEICFRGRHIMAGYMANPDLGEEHVEMIRKKNSDAIDAQGWLHSGDKGVLGKNGMYKITGRYKELIIGSGGENIAPVPIEDNIKKLCPAVSNIMMIGDKKKYNTAFVALKAKGASGDLPGGDELDGEALELAPGVTTISEAMANQRVVDAIKDAIFATNSTGSVCPSNASKIQKFSILPHDFSVQTNELTPTLKLKRGAVMSDPFYADVLDRLYAPENRSALYVPFHASTVVGAPPVQFPGKEDEKTGLLNAQYLQ